MVLQGEAGGPYRGPDRRARNEGLFACPSLPHVLGLAAVVSVVALAPALILVPRHPSGADVATYAAVAAGLGYAVAGGSRLVAWKVTGRAIFGWVGAALVVLGVMIVACDGLFAWGFASEPAVRPAGSLLWTALVGSLIWKGLADQEVNAGLRPFLILAVTLGAGLAGMGLLGATQDNGLLPPWLTGRPAAACLGGVSALIWVTIGVLSFCAARRQRPGVPPWAFCTAALLAASVGVNAISPGRWASAVVTSACVFAAATVLLGTSIYRVQQILAWEDRAQRRLQLALTASVYQTARDRHALEHWLHDLRNAVAGLQAADAVRHDVNGAAPPTEHELGSAITAELARLHAMCYPDRQLKIGEVDLAATLGPIVAAERSLGGSVALRLRTRTVVADAPSLGRVVQNLLTNARLYAPGAAVTLTAERRADMVEISIHDCGPGIAIPERSLVFEAARRGLNSAGTAGNGLGLYVARTLVTAMGGTITLAPAASTGCRMVVALPAPVRVLDGASAVPSSSPVLPARLAPSS